MVESEVLRTITSLRVRLVRLRVVEVGTLRNERTDRGVFPSHKWKTGRRVV
jgi:hypothetical protein